MLDLQASQFVKIPILYRSVDHTLGKWCQVTHRRPARGSKRLPGTASLGDRLSGPTLGQLACHIDVVVRSCEHSLE